jgi:hypothetical protein
MEKDRLSEQTHTYGCAFKQRGAECDCNAFVYDFRARAASMDRETFATEMGRAMSRGFDYRLLAGGFDEGIHDDEEEGAP